MHRETVEHAANGIRARLGGHSIPVKPQRFTIPLRKPPGAFTAASFWPRHPRSVRTLRSPRHRRSLRHLLPEGAAPTRGDHCFRFGSPILSAESVAPIRPFCAGIYTRRTLSFDFGSWHLAWCILRQRGWSLDQFDRFVIANDSVFGPLFPLEEMWSSFHGADMYGAIETPRWSPTSNPFSWLGLNSRTRSFLNDLWDEFQYTVHKGTLIWRYEVGLSRRAHKAGLSVKPFVSPPPSERPVGAHRSCGAANAPGEITGPSTFGTASSRTSGSLSSRRPWCATSAGTSP